MGHDIVKYRDRHVFVRDHDLWAVRHFLLAEAQQGKDSALTTFIQGWECVGNGVWLGVELDEFLQQDADRERQFLDFLAASRRRLEAFGEVVPLEYIASSINLPTTWFDEAQPVSRWLKQLDKLRELIPGRGP